MKAKTNKTVQQLAKRCKRQVGPKLIRRIGPTVKVEAGVKLDKAEFNWQETRRRRRWNWW